jgi:hypothetical protein
MQTSELKFRSPFQPGDFLSIVRTLQTLLEHRSSTYASCLDPSLQSSGNIHSHQTHKVHQYSKIEHGLQSCATVPTTTVDYRYDNNITGVGHGFGWADGRTTIQIHAHFGLQVITSEEGPRRYDAPASSYGWSTHDGSMYGDSRTNGDAAAFRPGSQAHYHHHGMRGEWKDDDF